MKKIITIALTFLSLVSCTNLDEVWAELRDHEERIQRLEALCNRLNSNVEAIQTILTAIQQNDYVTEVMKIVEDGVEVGYSLTFAKSGNVTIYHGTNGSNGITPKIGVQKASDGAYYWTANGEWVTNEDGDMVPATVSVPDGDYVSPQFRVADGVWYVSYDNGNTWRMLEQDQSGGDSFFKDVQYDGKYICFTLLDDTKVVIPLINKVENHWSGKKWYAYGTSLTSDAQGKYVPYVAAMSGLNVVNKGIGGGGIISNTKIKDAVMNTTDGKLEADIITLEVGANDASAPLGNAWDNTADTFLGSLTQCINYLLQNTNAQIVVLSSPIGKYTSSGGSTEITPDKYKYLERWQGIRDVCIKCGVHYIGLADESGLGWARLNNNMGVDYNTDNIHHTDIAGYNLAVFMWSKLKDIPCWYTSVPEVGGPSDDGFVDASSYWAGKKMIWNGDSISYGSWLSSPETDAYPYLVGRALGMETYNFAIGGSYAAKPKGAFEEYYWDYDKWLKDVEAGVVDTTKKYLVKDCVNAKKPCRIYYYDGATWKANSETGGWAIVERVKEMVALHPDADVIGIAIGTNDFFTSACPFGNVDAANYRNLEEVRKKYKYDETVNLIDQGERYPSTKLLKASYTLEEDQGYTVYANIPVEAGREYRAESGYRSWFLDAEKNPLSTFNLKDQDFQFKAPQNACYVSITFSGDASGACVYGAKADDGTMSEAEKNLTHSTFCGAIHTICKYLLDNYKNKDIVFVTPIKRYQGWCQYPEDKNSLGYTLKDYSDAIIEICSYYSIPVIDFYSNSGLNPHIDTSLFGDTDGKAVHPNEEGHRRLASLVIAYLQGLRHSM